MKPFFLPTTFLIIGFCLGWLSKDWLAPSHHLLISDTTQQTNIDDFHSGRPLSDKNPTPDNRHSDKPMSSPSATALTRFKLSLTERRYQDAMLIYQQEAQLGKHQITTLKEALLSYLTLLLETNNQNDFSKLTGLFLASYYDDIDVLLLLTKFNHANHAYLEAINVYQQAYTYAYTKAQQQLVQKQFNQFVHSTDDYLSKQQDWFALSNFYTQIEAAGLLTAQHRFRQAIAYLRNGNRLTAIELLQQLQNDRIVGTQASNALNELNHNTSEPSSIENTAWQSAQAIPLQRSGNHYLININLNQSDNVTLLIDTGASITTLSHGTFATLSSISQASEIGIRVFQTASGPATGTLYTTPQINIGPYQMQDVQVAVLDFTMPQGVDGLLGMNILGQYRFQIDQENAQLLLRKK